MINEVQYDPPQQGVDTAFEWIELLNRTGQTIDLTGWSLNDNHESDPIPSLSLPPGDFAVIAATTDFYANFPNFSGNLVFMADGSIGNGLSNTGDRLILADPTGKIIDSLSYDDDNAIMSPPCHDVPEGHSLERQPPGLDTNQASDFVDNSTPSPGCSLPSATEMPTPSPTSTTTPTLTQTPTQTLTLTPSPSPTPNPTPTLTLTPPPTPIPTPIPTPTRTLTPPPSPTLTTTPTPTLTPTPTPSPTATPSNEGDVVINEVQYNPPQQGTDAALEWLELLNRTGQTIDLTGWSLSDNHESDPITSLALLTGDFAIIAATTSFYTDFPNFSGNIVFMADGSIGNGLSNTGDRLILADPTGKIIDSLSYGDDNTIMSPPCRDVPESHSLERQPPGLDTNQASDFVDNSTPSPGCSLPSATPTPTLTPSPTPTSKTTTTPSPTPMPTPTPAPLPTPTPTTTATPAPNLTPKLTLTPNVTISPSVSQAQPWIHTKMPAFLFLIGLTLLVAAVFRLKKQG